MEYKSRAISLTYIKYGDSSIISRVFTEEKGLQTFIIKGIRSKESKKNLSNFEPLTLVNIDANINAKKSLQYLKDIRIAYNLRNQKNKLDKNLIAFFIAEVTSRVLQENDQNSMLFNFIWNTSSELYSSEKKDKNFNLKFLLNLCSFLGFYPSLSKIQNPFFNLSSGEFCNEKSSFDKYLSQKNSTYLKMLLNNKDLIIPQEQKTELLKELLTYYKLHHYNLDSIKSHLVIETLRE